MALAFRSFASWIMVVIYTVENYQINKMETVIIIMNGIKAENNKVKRQNWHKFIYLIRFGWWYGNNNTYKLKLQ